jgi:hypothetical protein
MLPAIDQKNDDSEERESQMKNLILKSTMFLSAAVLMGVGAQAQSLKVSIPFAFEANGKGMPAGDYDVHASSNMSSGIYTMRNKDTHESVLLISKVPIYTSSTTAKLVFLQAADGYYLTELWDGSMGRTLRAPRGRNSIVATTKPATRVVVLAQK